MKIILGFASGTRTRSAKVLDAKNSHANQSQFQTSISPSLYSTTKVKQHFSAKKSRIWFLDKDRKFCSDNVTQ